MASKMREFDDYSHNLATRVEALMKVFEIMPRNMPAGSVIQLQLERLESERDKPNPVLSLEPIVQ